MNRNEIIAELERERAALDVALNALRPRTQLGQPLKAEVVPIDRPKRTMSPAARRKISRLMKARWAERKRRAA